MKTRRKGWKLYRVIGEPQQHHLYREPSFRFACHPDTLANLHVMARAMWSHARKTKRWKYQRIAVVWTPYNWCFGFYSTYWFQESPKGRIVIGGYRFNDEKMVLDFNPPSTNHWLNHVPLEQCDEILWRAAPKEFMAALPRKFAECDWSKDAAWETVEQFLGGADQPLHILLSITQHAKCSFRELGRKRVLNAVYERIEQHGLIGLLGD